MSDELDGRCPQCSEDELDVSVCKYCGWPDHYRGWSIEQNRFGQWEATGPNYDASYEGPEDGWVSNGQCVEAPTRAALIAEIDTWIEENS